MARYKFDTLSSLIRNGYLLRVSCRCGHVVKLDPAIILTRFKVSRLNDLEGRLKCSNCGRRDCGYSACFGDD